MKTETLACENCGFPNELLYHQCKIICQNCGWMLDCSDLDVGNEIKQASLRQSRLKRIVEDSISLRLNQNSVEE